MIWLRQRIALNCSLLFCFFDGLCKMFLIVGLGNPGKDYENTRHNVGFMTIDVLAKEYGFGVFKEKFDGLVAEGNIAGEKVFLLKPLTFMNLSGNSVVKAANFYKILPENVVVVHDDMDLPIGKIKAKIGGGSGGHNGIKSIDAAISPQYNRVRIGINHSSGDKNDTKNFVLSRFGRTELQEINSSIEMVCKTINVLLNKGVNEYSSLLGMMTKKS